MKSTCLYWRHMLCCCMTKHAMKLQLTWRGNTYSAPNPDQSIPYRRRQQLFCNTLSVPSTKVNTCGDKQKNVHQLFLLFMLGDGKRVDLIDGNSLEFTPTSCGAMFRTLTVWLPKRLSRTLQMCQGSFGLYFTVSMWRQL